MISLVLNPLSRTLCTAESNLSASLSKSKEYLKAIDKLKGVGNYSIYNKKGLEVYEYEIHLELYEIYKNDFEDLEEACDELQKAKSSFEEDIDALIYHPDALSEIEALIKSNCQR